MEFIEVAAKQIDEQLGQLEEQLGQLKDQISRLEAAKRALGGREEKQKKPVSEPSVASSRRRGRPRKPQASQRRNGGERRGRNGKRGQQALELVRSHPGITIPELAKEMEIAPNYLYRVLPPLEESGQLKRDGKSWHPVEQEPAPAA